MIGQLVVAWLPWFKANKKEFSQLGKLNTTNLINAEQIYCHMYQSNHGIVVKTCDFVPKGMDNK